MADSAPGLTDFTVAALQHGQINDHRTGTHGIHHGAGNQQRSWTSRHLRRADHHVSLVEVFRKTLPLLLQK